MDYPVDVQRPRVRGDCEGGARPCPFVSCKYNLFLDVKNSGGIYWNFGQDVAALESMPETCALDVADKGGVTLNVVGDALDVNRERIRQIETLALSKIAGLFD